MNPGKNTLGESTSPNHRRHQLNGLLCSTAELDHQPCTRTTSNFLVALNPRVRNKLQQESFHAALSLRVRNKLSDGLMKREKHSTHAFTAKFLRAQHGVPCYSSALIYIALPRSYAIPIKSPIRYLNPYDLGSCLVVEFWIGFDQVLSCI